MRSALALVLLAVAACKSPAPAESAPSASAPSPPAPTTTAFAPGRIPKVDIHAHIDPDVARPARALMQAHGIGRVVNVSGGWVGEGLQESMAAATEPSGFYVVFANIDWTGVGEPGWAAREIKRMERAKAMGVRGMKIAKNLGLGVVFADGRRVPVDDPVLDPVFEAIGRLKLPVLIHTGDPKAFFDPVSPANERFAELESHPRWSFADRSRFPAWEALFGEYEHRVKRSKGTTFIGAHFGNDPEDPSRVGRMLDECPNLYVDTAARVPEIGRRPAETKKVILAHSDRVVFGTDLQAGSGMLVLGAGPPGGHPKGEVDRFFTSTWRFFETADRAFAHPTPIQGLWTIDGIELPNDVLEAVYHKNAERLLGLPPTPLTE
jgi:predicted TIM-barrel fold metal-dependent hydrolase